jgi:hypothetical protein
MIRKSIYYNKASIYGGVEFTVEELVFDGVPVTYIVDVPRDGLDIWMIPYLVVFGLVLLGIAASLHTACTESSVEPTQV